jgi:hypothetical protein
MKIIITESQSKLLTEQVEGLDEFREITLSSYPEVEEYWDVIENFIRLSGVKRIEVEPIRMGVAVSLLTGIIFNKNAFFQPLTAFLFTIFHELAHQYQYRKYGKEKMLKLYTSEMSIEEAAKFMKEIEEVADELATRKLRELQKYGYLSNVNIPKGFYKQLSLKSFENTIKYLKSQVEDSGLTSPDEISNLFYNWLKDKVQPI